MTSPSSPPGSPAGRDPDGLYDSWLHVSSSSSSAPHSPSIAQITDDLRREPQVATARHINRLYQIADNNAAVTAREVAELKEKIAKKDEEIKALTELNATELEKKRVLEIDKAALKEEIKRLETVLAVVRARAVQKNQEAEDAQGQIQNLRLENEELQFINKGDVGPKVGLQDPMGWATGVALLILALGALVVGVVTVSLVLKGVAVLSLILGISLLADYSRTEARAIRIAQAQLRNQQAQSVGGLL